MLSWPILFTSLRRNSQGQTDEAVEKLIHYKLMRFEPATQQLQALDCAMFIKPPDRLNDPLDVGFLSFT